jgi:hypothetical protein
MKKKKNEKKKLKNWQNWKRTRADMPLSFAPGHFHRKKLHYREADVS